MSHTSSICYCHPPLHHSIALPSQLCSALSCALHHSLSGQPVLLPPGIHQWQSQTMVFDRVIDLNDHVIRLGPYTLITIDEGGEITTKISSSD